MPRSLGPGDWSALPSAPYSSDMAVLSFEELVRALSDPGAYPGPAATVECVQTHISVVFLVDRLAYKLKRPKNLGFLDFTSLEDRRRFCHEEVRLNRRLAPGVYEGVVPVVLDEGVVRASVEVVESPTADPGGQVLEWAVRMVRLPGDRRLGALIKSDRVGPGELQRLAGRLARFHAAAERGSRISECAGWENVWRNDRENFEQIEKFIGRTISVPVFEMLKTLMAGELERRRALIERRAREGVAREIHGDLRLDHVYLLPPGVPGRSERGSADASRSGEAEFVIIDCIEFNERFRWADPVSDIAFLVMELEFIGRTDLAAAFSRAYFTAANDSEGSELLPYYVSYRDVVRGKVRCLQSEDELLGAGARAEAAAIATRHFFRALLRLSRPSDRPALVIVHGLPGVGKSTVSQALAGASGFHWIDTDRVRKELAAAAGAEGAGVEEYGGGIYSAEWNERTYLECERRAREILWSGGRVVVEGSFRRERHRVSFLETARSLGVAVLFLHCSAGPAEARSRLAKRSSDTSDANWSIHEKMARDWEAPSPSTASFTRELSLEGEPDQALLRARAILKEEGLV
ncbi:MAG: AAA family ATPase [Gemmatimonadota bacterium]